MVEFRIEREEPSKPKTLADVPVGEVWLDKDGDAVWRNESGACYFINKTDGIISVGCNYGPNEIKITEKLTDEIRIRW
jgi:hypothetical protein